MHRAFHVFGKQMTVKINHEKFRRHKSEYALIFLMGIHQFEVWEDLVNYFYFHATFRDIIPHMNRTSFDEPILCIIGNGISFEPISILESYRR